MNESKLILEATKGDADALEALLRNYQPWLRQIVEREASRQLLRFADVDEIVQHAMAGCFRAVRNRNLEQKTPAQFEAWLATVLRNAIYYFARKRKRALLQLTSDAADALRTGGPRASQLQRRNERYERLNAAIAQLPETTQQVIALLLKGRTMQQIADALGMTRASVNSRLERARHRLRGMLGNRSSNFSSE